MNTHEAMSQVKSILDGLGIEAVISPSGKIKTAGDLTPEKRDKLLKSLSSNDFQPVEDTRLVLIEKIKSLIIETIHFTEEPVLINYSAFLSDRLQLNYTSLSKYFSKYTATTIEHFIIAQKIERVKDLLIYQQLKLSEIARKMHYSSIGHLSNQFKKVTGLTPSEFRNRFFQSFNLPNAI